MVCTIKRANDERFAKLLLAKSFWWEIRQSFPPPNIRSIRYCVLVHEHVMDYHFNKIIKSIHEHVCVCLCVYVCVCVFMCAFVLCMCVHLHECTYMSTCVCIVYLYMSMLWTIIIIKS